MRVRTPRSRVALTAAAVSVTALTLGLAATANAATARPTDTGARTGDAVGVGSDTLQNAADFVLDAAANGGSGGGYNAIGNVARVFNVYATGDANGRATYDGTCGVGTATAPASQCTSANASAGGTAADNRNPLMSTVVLRGGSNPVLRPNGSGAGVAALIADSPGGGSSYEGLPTGSIQFARMSRLPNSGEEGSCSTSTACAGLHVYQLATDNLQIAHLANGYNGPSGLSLSDLVAIYQCTTTTWNKLPGNSGGSTATIRPLIPQSGSGTRNFFLADLQAANGNTAIKLGSCVGTVEEHDPDGIYEDTQSANAVEPFSTGKLSLINSGYFMNGNTTAGAGTPAATTTNSAFTPGLLTSDPGTNSADGGNSTAYTSSRGLYVVLRQEDVANTDGLSAFNAGSTQTFAQTLFDGRTSYAARAAQSSSYAAAGFTQAYKDCGINPTTC